MTDRIIPQAEYDIDLEPPATAADWLEPGPEDRHPYGFEPRTYVTEISVPDFGDGGIQRLHSRMREPGPDASYQAYLDAQAAANAARGSTQPTLRNTAEAGTPEADRVAALDRAAAEAWERHCAVVLGPPEPEPEPEAEAGL